MIGFSTAQGLQIQESREYFQFRRISTYNEGAENQHSDFDSSANKRAFASLHNHIVS